MTERSTEVKVMRGKSPRITMGIASLKIAPNRRCNVGDTQARFAVKVVCETFLRQLPMSVILILCLMSVHNLCVAILCIIVVLKENF